MCYCIGANGIHLQERGREQIGIAWLMCHHPVFYLYEVKFVIGKNILWL